MLYEILQWFHEGEVSFSSKNQGKPHEGNDFFAGLGSSDVWSQRLEVIMELNRGR